MKKYLSLILSAIMVLSLFAAVAMARAEQCSYCGGRITLTIVGPYGEKQVGEEVCKTTGGWDEKYVVYYDYHYVCSTAGCPETYTETHRSYYTRCNH